MNNYKSAHCQNCGWLKSDSDYDWQDKDYIYYFCTCPVECGRTQFKDKNEPIDNLEHSKEEK